MATLLQRYIEAIPWLPQEGPQEAAMLSRADVLLYGGAAGGGKSALACGLAITRHEQSLILRREATQLGGILDEIAGIIDPTRDGYSGQSKEWKIPAWDGVDRKIILGSCPNPGDEMRHQGRPKDLIVFDEAANFLESQVRFIMGWLRSRVEFTLTCSPAGDLHSATRVSVPARKPRVLSCESKSPYRMSKGSSPTNSRISLPLVTSTMDCPSSG